MPRAKGIRVMLLVEDEALERFAQGVLKKLGFGPREVRVHKAPGGQNAKQWVTRAYPTEVKAHRREANHQQIAILVGTEADEQTVSTRREGLARSLAGAGLEPREAHERIALWIPKWHVETWLLFLTGDDVTEDEQYKRDPRIRDFREFGTAAERFVERFRRFPDEPGKPSLPSLKVAYQETQRLS